MADANTKRLEFAILFGLCNYLRAAFQAHASKDTHDVSGKEGYAHRAIIHVRAV